MVVVKKQIILWGGTGQAKVNRPIIESLGYELLAVFDDTDGLESPFSDIAIYKGWQGFEEWKIDKDLKIIGFCIAIGNPHGRVRLELSEKLKKEGLSPISLIHPSAIIDKSVIIGEGVQIMAGSIIQAESIIGRQCIINTKASIDHEAILEDGCEVGPGATLCGNISMKKNSWVCAGATILPRLTIGENTIIGASSLLTKNAGPNKILYGIPAKIIRNI